MTADFPGSNAQFSRTDMEDGTVALKHYAIRFGLESVLQQTAHIETAICVFELGCWIKDVQAAIGSWLLG